MHRWGYAPSYETLRKQLLGGAVEAGRFHAQLDQDPEVICEQGYACLPGFEPLLQKSRDRAGSNRRHSDAAWEIARAYARDLMRACPALDCVALSGSLASGGYGSEDDIDFDLIVRPGTKYTCYLLAHVIGLKYGWRYRHRRLDELHHTPLLPKIACINVVWTVDQMRPFERRDENLAFELMRCIPMFGSQRFQGVLEDNPWIQDYFPQIYARVWPEEPVPGFSLLGRVLSSVLRDPGLARIVESISRRISWRLYRGVQRSRSRNPAAKARMDFLRRAKYPYEVFQD